MNNQNNYFITELPLKRFQWGDAVFIVFMIIGILFSFRLFSAIGSSSNVVIYKENTIIAEYPLSEDRTVSIKGKLGDVEVCIKNKAVGIIKSSCDHQICVRNGAITNKYGQIVCAPNHILICIRSRESNRSQVDAIAR